MRGKKLLNFLRGEKMVTTENERAAASETAKNEPSGPGLRQTRPKNGRRSQCKKRKKKVGKMFLSGLRFGLLLQLAVGPVCLMVFNTAGTLGFLMGSLAALAVTVVDGLYIALAALGISAFLQNERVKKIIRAAGAVVLVLFGLDIAAGALGASFLPQIAMLRDSGTENVFLRAAILTGSNPLTIVFWGGVFSTRITAEDMERSRIFPFGAGCAGATFLFLNGVAVAGSVARSFLSPALMAALNVGVGLAIVFFALRMAGLSKHTPPGDIHTNLKSKT
jgi:threonine/homoserine/homoserine lactone efflux protein